MVEFKLELDEQDALDLLVDIREQLLPADGLSEFIDWMSLLTNSEFEAPLIEFTDEDGVVNYMTYDNNDILCTTTDLDDQNMYEPLILTKENINKSFENVTIYAGEALK